MVSGAPFARLLIANRGEIAVRVARTCRAMGIATVAVYSDADAGAVHVRACDEAVRIGPPPARDSYLNIDAVLDAARRTGATAIHPGYGFLSENADFAAACERANVTFVGPTAAAMRAVGDKIAAKRLAAQAEVPTVPGDAGDDQSPAALRASAKRIGTPLLVKASAGGGGKGMRVVDDLAGFDEALAAAKREAQAAFGSDVVLLERYLAQPRHVEIQVLADAHGGCVWLGERECSVQRRHQKVFEETPSVALTPDLRARMGEAAVRLMRAAGYVNAGTVEFLLADGGFYFLEVNARLQVEHPITELTTGLDLVREQLLVAAGQPLRFSQSDITTSGHAIEVRVCAEDARRDFLPTPGNVVAYEEPSGDGVRVDSGVDAGSVVGTNYDSLLAKLIVSAPDRTIALQRLRHALDGLVIDGITTNIDFLRWLVRDPELAAGRTTTSFVTQRFAPPQLAPDEDAVRACIAGAGALFDAARGWRHSAAPRRLTFAHPAPVTIEGHRDFHSNGWLLYPQACGRRLSSSPIEDGPTSPSPQRCGRTVEAGPSSTYTVDGVPFTAVVRDDGVDVDFGWLTRVRLARPESVTEAARGHAPAAAQAGGSVEAPMTGTIVKVLVREGEAVAPRQTLAVMEAMKTEHTIAAPYAGCVAKVGAAAGQRVAAGAELFVIEARGSDFVEAR